MHKGLAIWETKGQWVLLKPTSTPISSRISINRQEVRYPLKVAPNSRGFREMMLHPQVLMSKECPKNVSTPTLGDSINMRSCTRSQQWIWIFTERWRLVSGQSSVFFPVVPCFGFKRGYRVYYYHYYYHYHTIYKHLAVAGSKLLTLINIVAVIVFYINFIIIFIYIFKSLYNSI